MRQRPWDIAVVAVVIAAGFLTYRYREMAVDREAYERLAVLSTMPDAAERLKVIVTRHEQAAGYMAYGYAAASGRPGVYCVVPGPGFLNTAAALATAYACNAPVVCLAGQVPLRRIGRGFGLLHELPDQLGIMQRLTKWAMRVEAPHDAPPCRQMEYAHGPPSVSANEHVTGGPEAAVTVTS